MFTAHIQEKEEGLRLDRWLKERFPTFPHSWFEKAIRRGVIRLDGKKTQAHIRLAQGAAVCLPDVLQADPAPSPASVPQRPSRPALILPKSKRYIESLILHQDKHIIILNKPAGLATQGGHGERIHIDMLLDCLSQDSGVDERPRLVHRLDKETSGLLILARTRKAAQHLSVSLASGHIHKVYWALAACPIAADHGLIDLALVKEGGARTPYAYVKPDPTGTHARSKKAQTQYHVLHRHAWGHIVSLTPLTGRTHQLRVHLAKGLKSPIVGDTRYGFRYRPSDKNLFGPHLYLHARQLAFPHPSGSHDMFTITAPLPDYMSLLFEKMAFSTS